MISPFNLQESFVQQGHLTSGDILRHPFPWPKFPSTAVVPMASCSTPGMTSVTCHLPCSGPRFLKIKPQAMVHGALAKCCARWGRHTWAMCCIHLHTEFPSRNQNHRIPEWFFKSGLNVMNYHSKWAGMILPLPKNWNMAEIDSNSTCFQLPWCLARPYYLSATKNTLVPCMSSKIWAPIRHWSWHKDFIKTCSTTFNTFVFCKKLGKTFASPRCCTWFRWNAAHLLQPDAKMCRRVTRE